MVGRCDDSSAGTWDKLNTELPRRIWPIFFSIIVRCVGNLEYQGGEQLSWYFNKECREKSSITTSTARLMRTITN